MSFQSPRPAQNPSAPTLCKHSLPLGFYLIKKKKKCSATRTKKKKRVFAAHNRRNVLVPMPKALMMHSLSSTANREKLGEKRTSRIGDDMDSGLKKKKSRKMPITPKPRKENVRKKTQRTQRPQITFFFFVASLNAQISEMLCCPCTTSPFCIKMVIKVMQQISACVRIRKHPTPPTRNGREMSRVWWYSALTRHSRIVRKTATVLRGFKSHFR